MQSIEPLRELKQSHLRAVLSAFQNSRKVFRTECSSVPVKHQLRCRIKKDCNITLKNAVKYFLLKYHYAIY